MGSSPVGDGGWWRRGVKKNNNNNNINYDAHVYSSFSGILFFICAFTILGLIGSLYARFMLGSTAMVLTSFGGCREDNEGSWSIGVFYGDSPFSLKPIEDMNVWKNDSAAWPVANPVVNCATVSESGLLSNFVADPFLYIQGDVLYLFFETKNPITMQGDIGVAKSIDKGATWVPLGLALDEDWHLSYPYVFEYNGNVYMMPEGSQKGELRLYKAVNFPLEWSLERVILKKGLIDSFIIPYNGTYWLFGSDHSGIGTKKNGQLEIWYSRSPLGPWKAHKKNPIYNTHKSRGARNGGRPFIYNGDLYRVGQDCGKTYGRRIRVFKVIILTVDDFQEIEMKSGIYESVKGRNSWNGSRNHHLDAQKLSSGEWIAVVDADKVPSGDPSRRFLLGCAAAAAVAAAVVLVGIFIGADSFWVPQRKTRNLNLRSFSGWVIKVSLFLRKQMKRNPCVMRVIVVLVSVFTVILMCIGVKYIYGGSGAQEAYLYNGHYSQFTLLTMTYDARIWNLKMYIKHYSRCSSVREIVVVWNKGTPPLPSDFDSAVPVRVRVEEKNSLNNRFKPDDLIKTRAVLELDDDIMMTCDDIERGFRVWREQPEKIVGFYPRLVNGSPLEYRGEKHARGHNGYNMILTGAAFIDGRVAFERYWSKKNRVGREIVDEFFNCEDVLLNYLYANESNLNQSVEYVKPTWAIDTSKFSGVAISGNTRDHYRVRSECLEKFSEMYGSLTDRISKFGSRVDGWDV